MNTLPAEVEQDDACLLVPALILQRSVFFAAYLVCFICVLFVCGLAV